MRPHKRRPDGLVGVAQETPQFPRRLVPPFPEQLEDAPIEDFAVHATASIRSPAGTHRSPVNRSTMWIGSTWCALTM